jgi:proline iminopeptidase
VFDGNEFSEQYLLADVMTMDLSGWTTFRIPVILLEGRHDRTVNSDVAYEWFNKVKAPEKHFVWFENSAHEPGSEEPGKFLVALVRYARPIAVKVGDGAP